MATTPSGDSVKGGVEHHSCRHPVDHRAELAEQLLRPSAPWTTTYPIATSSAAGSPITSYNFIDIAAQLPAFYLTRPETSYLATLAEYHTFSPTVTNEFRLGYNRFNQPIPAGNFQFPGLNAFPNLTFDDLGGLQLGPNPNAPQSTVQNLYQGADNLTWIKGNHTFKFGTDFRKSISPQTFTQRCAATTNGPRFRITSTISPRT